MTAAATVTPAAVDVLLVLAATPGAGVATVRATWRVNRATALRWIREAAAQGDPDDPTATRWRHLAAITDGAPVPGRPYRTRPLTGIEVPDLAEHDLHAPTNQPDPVTALVERDQDRRGDQR